MATLPSGPPPTLVPHTVLPWAPGCLSCWLLGALPPSHESTSPHWQGRLPPSPPQGQHRAHPDGIREQGWVIHGRVASSGDMSPPPGCGSSLCYRAPMSQRQHPIQALQYPEGKKTPNVSQNHCRHFLPGAMLFPILYSLAFRQGERVLQQSHTHHQDAQGSLGTGVSPHLVRNTSPAGIRPH